MRKPSAALWFSSDGLWLPDVSPFSLAGVSPAGLGAVLALDAFTSVCWKAPDVLVRAGAAFALRFLRFASGAFAAEPVAGWGAEVVAVAGGAETACMLSSVSIFRFHSEAGAPAVTVRSCLTVSNPGIATSMVQLPSFKSGKE